MPLRICIISADETLAGSLACYLPAGHTISCIAGIDELKNIRPVPELIITELTADGEFSPENVSMLHKLRETRHTPVIVISSSPEFEYELGNIFDFILKPVDMQRLSDDVEKISRGAEKPGRNLSVEQFREAEYRLFYDYLVTRSGLRFEPRNVKFLTRGIRTRMQVLHIDSFRDYFDYLTLYQESRQELQKLLQLLTVGETYFFRYRAHFDVLTRLVRKELSADPGKKIRIWSAGCSTGEEPYSIAMSIIDAIPEWRKMDIAVFATDINKSSLKKGNEGNYRPWVMRAMGKHHIWRYFDQSGDTYRIKDEVKELVRFFHLNLQTSILPAPAKGLAGLDAIFCRNVLIYFDMEATRRILAKMAAALRPGGYLFLGHAEMLSFLSSQFERHTFAGGYYYRKKTGGEPPQAFPRERRPTRERRSAVGGRNIVPVPPAIPTANGQEPDPELLYRQAQDLFDDEDFAGASQRLEELLRRKPDHVGALVAQGFLLANNGLLEESMTLCAKALALDDLLPDAYFLKGLVLEIIDQPEQAVAEYRKAILLNMEFLMPHYYLGRLFLSLGREKEGARELRTCVRILERKTGSGSVPYAGRLTGEMLLEQLRRELLAAEGQPVAERFGK